MKQSTGSSTTKEDVMHNTENKTSATDSAGMIGVEL